MKNFTFLILLNLVFCNIQAQGFVLRNVSMQTCAYDTNTTITQLDNWEIYQTENNLWDGSRLQDCHKVSKVGFKYYLNLDQIDVSKPIFIESINAKVNDETLLSDWVYSSYSSGRWYLDSLYDLSRNCGDEICSGVILGIKIPTEDSLSTTQRIHKLQYTDQFYMEACLPTEYFDDQIINTVIIKLTLNEINTNLDSLEIPISEVFIERGWEDVVTFDGILVSDNSGPDQEININISEAIDTDYSLWILGLHNPAIYPTSGNNTYLEVGITDQSDTLQKNINLLINDYQNISFQPYTELIGALVNGSDSLRHQVTIVQEGGNMCISLVELVFGTGTIFKYKSGDVYLGSQNACLKFSDGAQLIIDHTDMVYGDDNAAGMMALNTGSEVRMLGTASLEFNNTLAILSPNSVEEAYIDIYLEKGQSLSFSKTGHVISFGKPMIRVHMLGGSIDLSELDELEQSKFILIYPSPKSNINENITIYPNPVIDQLSYTYLTKTAQLSDWKISDIAGRTIALGKNSLLKGSNQNNINVNGLDRGTYFFSLYTKEGIISKPFIK